MYCLQTYFTDTIFQPGVREIIFSENAVVLAWMLRGQPNDP